MYGLIHYKKRGYHDKNEENKLVNNKRNFGC